MKKLTIALALATQLSGCAWTPEQHRAGLAAMGFAAQRHLLYQQYRQPYQQPAVIYTPVQQPSYRCTSQYSGGYVYTHCK